MPDRNELRAITLDLDDTLWPVAPTLIAAEQALTDWLHAHAPKTARSFDADRRATIRRQVLAAHPGRGHDMSFLRHEMLRQALAHAGEAVSLADDAFAVFLAARQRVVLFDDVAPVLERWASRYRLIAVTNGNADVHRVGLGGHFFAAVSAHELGCAKPDPRMFHEACRLADADPAAVLHIGDDPQLDVIAARRAGLRSVWLRRPLFAHRHPADTCADDIGSHPPFESLHAIDAMLHGTA
jgi:FMN hydrolase / 5-amino-6-(5-phospho-D-ribitylamino)uracil phosphatase